MDVINEDGSITRNKGTPQERTEFPNQQGEKQPQELHVTVDAEQLKMAIEGQKKAEEKAEELAEKLNLIAEVDLEKKLTSLHVPESEKGYFREHPEELFGYEKGLKANQKHEIPSGSAPLSQAQLTGGLQQKEGFESIPQLIDHLHDLEKCGTPQEKEYAKEVLGKMTHKFLNQAKKEGKPLVFEDKDFQLLKQITANKRRREQLKRAKGTQLEEMQQ